MSEERGRQNLRSHIRHVHANEADTLDWSLGELQDWHMAEHAGPGTIRNHDPLDLSVAGRSSDPEPAPCCLSCLAADETCERPECLCHAGAVPALQATLDPLAAQEADMCPNCVTPWKCNGPHLSPLQATGEATDE